MVSNDFKRIMQAIYTDKSRVVCTNIHGERKDDSNDFEVEASITLEKGGRRKTVRTSEFDCIRYITQLRSIVETDGELFLTHIKSPEKYDGNIKFLIDEGNKKLHSALHDLESGKFAFTYSPHKLIDELFESPPGMIARRKGRFLPLLKDYYRVLALVLDQSNEALKISKRMVTKSPRIRELIEAVEWIQTAFALVTKNPLKNYKFYKNYVSFDSDILFEQLSNQMEITDEIIQLLIGKGSLNWRRDIPKMMDVYTRCVEPLRPLVNLIRVGLELRRGVQLPEEGYKLGHNIRVLKSDVQYGLLFACLDEQIRHGDAHTSTFIKGNQVEIRNGLTRKSKVIRTYRGIELANMTLELRQEFLPALVTATVLADFALLDQALLSSEYKILLATIGSC